MAKPPRLVHRQTPELDHFQQRAVGVACQIDTVRGVDRCRGHAGIGRVVQPGIRCRRASLCQRFIREQGHLGEA